MAKKKSTKKSTKKATSARTKKKGSPKSSKSSGNSNFDAAMENIETAWEETREKDNTGGSFEPPDVPDGDYVAQLTNARMAAYRRGDRAGTYYVNFRYTIVLGEYAGEVVSSRDDLSAEPITDDGPTRLALFIGRLQRMGIETSGLSVKQIPDLVQWLVDPAKNDDAKPYYRVAVRNTEKPQDDGSVRRFQNVYVNELLDREEVEQDIEA